MRDVAGLLILIINQNDESQKRRPGDLGARLNQALMCTRNKRFELIQNNCI